MEVFVEQGKGKYAPCFIAADQKLTLNMISDDTSIGLLPFKAEVWPPFITTYFFKSFESLIAFLSRPNNKLSATFVIDISDPELMGQLRIFITRYDGIPTDYCPSLSIRKSVVEKDEPDTSDGEHLMMYTCECRRRLRYKVDYSICKSPCNGDICIPVRVSVGTYILPPTGTEDSVPVSTHASSSS